MPTANRGARARATLQGTAAGCVGVRRDVQIESPFVCGGNARWSLPPARRIFRSPVRGSDALLICQRLFLTTKKQNKAKTDPKKKSDVATSPPPPRPDLPSLPLHSSWCQAVLAAGRPQLMSRQPLDAISAQSGRNPPPTPSHPPLHGPLPDLRLCD